MKLLQHLINIYAILLIIFQCRNIFKSILIIFLGKKMCGME